MSSFFKHFAQLLCPDFNRAKQQGDFYNSPLQCFFNSIKDPYQIPPHLMGTAKKPRDFNNLFELSNNDHAHFNDKRAQIIFAEVLLRFFNQTSLNPDFFNGIIEYVKSEHEQKKDTAPNTHAVDNFLYETLLNAALALVWAEYQHNGLTLANNSLLNTTIFKNAGDAEDKLLKNYQALYQARFEQLEHYLTWNLDNYLNLNNYTLTKPFNRGKNTPLDPFSFSVQYQQPLWQGLFGKLKERYQEKITFVNQEPFKFYKNGKQTNFYLTLLLIDLHEHLPNQSYNSLAAMNHANNTANDDSNYLAQRINQLTAEPYHTEPVFAWTLVKQKINPHSINRLVNNQYSSNTASLARQYYFNCERELDIVATEGAIKNYFVKVTLSAQLLAKLDDEGLLISVYVFYYHAAKRVSIPCEIIDEQDDNDSLVLTLKLNRFIIAALDFEPRETSCYGGIDYDNNKQDIVLAFVSDQFKNDLVLEQ